MTAAKATSATPERTAVIALLVGATVWGLIWYPYRALEAAGITAGIAATVTYLLAFCVGVVWLRPRDWRGDVNAGLICIAVSAGWCNIGFTVAVVYGDVMRVVLLFYLAPVWTVLFARVLLGERLVAGGYVVMAVALAGAAIMLWDPKLGLPVPRTTAEWIALSAGAAFALSNVLSRRAAKCRVEVKALAVLAGCTLVGFAYVVLDTDIPAVAMPTLNQMALLAVLTLILLSVNVSVQYGLTRVAANRAVVIYLFELVVTAASAWLLAGETLTPSEWCGGILIVLAGLWSERLAPDAGAKQHIAGSA